MIFISRKFAGKKPVTGAFFVNNFCFCTYDLRNSIDDVCDKTEEGNRKYFVLITLKLGI